jgi:phosphoserine phosphatase
MNENRPPLAVFDLCDTLVAENTTVGFLRFYAEATGATRLKRALRRWTSRRSPFFYLGAVAHRLAGVDLGRRRMLAALAGEPRDSLREQADIYAGNLLKHGGNEVVLEQLRELEEAGAEVIIVSSSIDIVVARIAARIGTNYLASELEFAGERCTGRLTRDLTGNKLAALDEAGMLSGRSVIVFTDNRTDRSLVHAADRATIIIPRGKKTEHWAGAGCDYIQL